MMLIEFTCLRNVIWAGDFNYRIGGGLSNEFVRQSIAEEDFMTLLAADQVRFIPCL